MNVIGELERLFATTLYPLRVPIAIGLLIVGMLVVRTARRRGWIAAARRHPARTVAVVVMALAIGLPTGWYLGSPLFIRTALDEPAPTVQPAAPTATSAAPTDGPTSAASNTPSSTPTPVPTTALAEPRTATFTGADAFHFGSGTATLIETTPGAWTIRFEDFSVRNGPDLFVYVSPSAAGYDPAAIAVGLLKATDGNFNMNLPAGAAIDPTAASVVIWCKQFAVQFAVAPFGG